ncbi:MAG: response regulator [Cellvibrionaceae bacterium]|nr:response regulator [Cellvibrionaceae bacterium]MCV6627703.1 response regulator [Cellvibrionaceae bacterium]
MSSGHILIVEDEPKLALLLKDYLARELYQVSCLHDGDGVLDFVREQGPDLILLDLMLPGKDGMSICRELRQFSNVPVIMTTARVEEIDRLLGLELGADDYICKPYSPREVVARVKTVLRRFGPAGSVPPDRNKVQVNEEAYEVRLGDKLLELTPVEFRLFLFLYQHPAQVFSRSQLMDKLYSDGRIVTDRTVDSHVKNLRRKLSAADPEQELIRSIYGVGYRYDP